MEILIALAVLLGSVVVGREIDKQRAPELEFKLPTLPPALNQEVDSAYAMKE